MKLNMKITSLNLEIKIPNSQNTKDLIEQELQKSIDQYK